MATRTKCNDDRPCALRDEFWGCRALDQAPAGPCRFCKPTLDAKPYDLGPRNKKIRKSGYRWDFVRVPK